MNKFLFTVVMAVSVVVPVVAEHASEKVPEIGPEKPLEKPPEELEEEKPAWFEAGIDLDLFSAYVWHNSVINDELVFQPCVWIDFTRLDPVYIGASIWQNWNLTGVQDDTRPRAMNETDFNVHIGVTAWQSDDEAYALTFELGNDFYTYRQVLDCPNSYELYLKASFDNPYVGVYGEFREAYNPIVGCYFETGLRKAVNLGEAFESESDILNRFSVGADWNVSFGSGRYFTNYLYGPLSEGAYDPETGEYEGERDMSNGIGGTTIKGTIAYQVCDHFSIGLLIAYTALLSDEARDAMDYAEVGSMYKQLVWGGLQAKVDF